MRTTLTIDDELIAAARSLARANSITLGEAVSELIRRGLSASSEENQSVLDSGFPVFTVKSGAHPITLEDIKRAEDDA
jgi:hypothetical protein